MLNTRAANRQRAIYIAGASGIKPVIPFDVDLLATKAKARITPEAWAYIAGGAGLENTMASNRSAFDNWQIVPRMLRNVEQRDTSLDLFGHKMTVPFFLAPIGVLEMAHPEADLAVARAAALAQVPYVFSNQASVPMEQCAAVMDGAPHFFQLYWSKSNELVASFLQRAQANGSKGIVVTLDTTMLGWRTRDLDLAYLPFLRGMGIAQYTSDPVFQQMVDAAAKDAPTASPKVTLTAINTLIAASRRHPGSFWENLRTRRGLRAVQLFTQIYSRPNITWADLPFLREHTDLPIILKGILHPDDARKAMDYGVDAVYVSNHGGRQVDGSISAIEALPEVVQAIRDKIPVLFDSGVRGGADIFKALALGATAVGIGRPYTYALAIAGWRGVAELLENWVADFELTMGLAGCNNLAAIRAAGVRKV